MAELVEGAELESHTVHALVEAEGGEEEGVADLGEGVADVDASDGLDDRADEEVTGGDVGHQNVVGGGGEMGEVLEDDEEKDVEE